MLKLTLSLFVKKFGLIATLFSKVGITSKQPTEQPIYITILSPRPNICVQLCDHALNYHSCIQVKLSKR